MTDYEFSDWIDIEILADRAGMTATKYIAKKTHEKEIRQSIQQRFIDNHPGYLKQKSREWRENHAGYNAEACKKYGAKNREKLRKASSEYYYRNREEILRKKRERNAVKRSADEHQGMGF